jgi:O-acetyl-ADP-ribose deacetylase (regulator of RNase III)
MITYKKGDLLNDNAAALVNTVNCVGVMGKGIALQFKNKYPANYRIYKKACDEGRVCTGKMHVVCFHNLVIINFPTKEDWRNPSKLEWVEEGLQQLAKVIKMHRIKSIAIPALGCSNGGLDWDGVKPLIEKYLGNSEKDIRVYEPI